MGWFRAAASLDLMPLIQFVDSVVVPFLGLLFLMRAANFLAMFRKTHGFRFKPQAHQANGSRPHHGPALVAQPLHLLIRFACIFRPSAPPWLKAFLQLGWPHSAATIFPGALNQSIPLIPTPTNYLDPISIPYLPNNHRRLLSSSSSTTSSLPGSCAGSLLRHPAPPAHFYLPKVHCAFPHFVLVAARQPSLPPVHLPPSACSLLTLFLCDKFFQTPGRISSRLVHTRIVSREGESIAPDPSPNPYYIESCAVDRSTRRKPDRLRRTLDTR